MVIYDYMFPTKLLAQHGCFIRVGIEEDIRGIPHSPGPIQN